MADLSVCASFIPGGVETMSGVSSSFYPLIIMDMSYLALMLAEGSLNH